MESGMYSETPVNNRDGLKEEWAECSAVNVSSLQSSFPSTIHLLPWHWNNPVFSQRSNHRWNVGWLCTNKGLSVCVEHIREIKTSCTKLPRKKCMCTNGKITVRSTHLCVCMLIQACLSACASFTLRKKTVSKQKHWAMQTLCNPILSHVHTHAPTHTHTSFQQCERW